jgi:ribokinase
LPSLIDYLLANRIQAGVLSGIKVNNPVSGGEAAAILRKQVKKAVVITLGEHGHVVDQGEGPAHVGSFAVEARDYSVAFDAFVGGFCADLIVEQSVTQAAAFGSAAGALALARTGSQASFTARKEIQDFLKQGPHTASR